MIDEKLFVGRKLPVTATEFAEIAGVSVSVVCNACRDYKIGEKKWGVWLIRQADVAPLCAKIRPRGRPRKETGDERR